MKTRHCNAALLVLLISVQSLWAQGQVKQEPPKAKGTVASVSFKTDIVPPVFHVPPGLKDRENLFRAGLNYLPEGMLVTGATLIGGQDFQLDAKQNQSLSKHLNEAYVEILKDPDLAGMRSALPYCFSGKKHMQGHYFLYTPKKIPKRPKCIVFLHGYGGNFQFFTWAMKQTFPDAVIIAPSWGVSWGSGDGRYLDRAVADAEKRLDMKLSQRWLVAISGGGNAGFRIYGQNPKAFKGYVCLASAPMTKTIRNLPKSLNVMMINGTLDQGFPIPNVRRQIRRLKEKTPKVRTEELVSDHFFLLSEKDETTKLLRSFVNETEAEVK